MKHEHKVTPVAKVLQMLQGMLDQAVKEKAQEVTDYSAYQQFCHDTAISKERDIKDGNEQIAQLEADIQKYESDIAQLTLEIEALDMDIASWEADKQEATALRKQEHADYEVTHKDYSESLDALERAINVLKKQDYDRVQASLLQVTNLDRVPIEEKRVINAFLAQDDNTQGFMDYNAPEANAYEFQSGGVIDMLEKLKVKFGDELASLEKEESAAEHAYQMMNQDLADQIEVATDDRNQKSEAKANTEQANADAKQSLAETTATRDADQKYLDDLNALCSMKASEYEARQRLRAEEIDALTQAIEIISTRVRPVTKKYLPQLVQTGAASHSLLQLSNKGIQQKVAAFLKERAQDLNSRVLMQVAEKAQDDPFKKVKKMIQDLITRLLEEANEEAEHKGWCDTELATNEQTRKQKAAEIDALTAQIDKLEADIALLTQQINDLNDALAELARAMSEATAQRQKEHATNTETIKDAKEAQEATAQALTILKEFYASAADATALAQGPAEDAAAAGTQTWDRAYKGMQGESGGVIGMLEVIESDLARLESETQAAEEQAAAEYERFMHASELDQVAKTKDVEYKEARRNNKQAELATAKEDLQHTQAELDAALAYYDKLKPSCVDAGVSYEDRVARRKEEIESLQQALRILSGEEIA